MDVTKVLTIILAASTAYGVTFICTIVGVLAYVDVVRINFSLYHLVLPLPNAILTAVITWIAFNDFNKPAVGKSTKQKDLEAAHKASSIPKDYKNTKNK